MTGILLMAFGGPEKKEDVRPFLANLMGSEPSPEVVALVIEKYELIGGGSPLPTITGRQAAGLQSALRKSGFDLPVAVGMKYWRPFIGTAVASLVEEGANRIVALSMSPHRSRTTIGGYEKELAEAKSAFPELTIDLIADWYDDPGFLDALAERAQEALLKFEGSDPEVIFTAHSVPLSHIEGGDPYAEQVKITAEGVAARLGLRDAPVAFQSRGRSPGPWLGPDVEDVLKKLAAEGKRNVLLAPIGFVSDHLETLYDIDVVYRRKAQVFGLNLERAACLNDSPSFIRALAGIVKNRLI